MANLRKPALRFSDVVRKGEHPFAPQYSATSVGAARFVQLEILEPIRRELRIPERVQACRCRGVTKSTPLISPKRRFKQGKTAAMFWRWPLFANYRSGTACAYASLVCESVHYSTVIVGCPETTRPMMRACGYPPSAIIRVTSAARLWSQATRSPPDVCGSVIK